MYSKWKNFTSWNTLRKIFQNTGFLWPVFPHISTESEILTIHCKIRVREKPYSGTSYQGRHLGRMVQYKWEYQSLNMVLLEFCFFYPLMHNAPKWSKTLLKSYNKCCSKCCRILKVCLAILGSYALKG